MAKVLIEKCWHETGTQREVSLVRDRARFVLVGNPLHAVAILYLTWNCLLPFETTIPSRLAPDTLDRPYHEHVKIIVNQTDVLAWLKSNLKGCCVVTVNSTRRWDDIGMLHEDRRSLAVTFTTKRDAALFRLAFGGDWHKV